MGKKAAGTPSTAPVVALPSLLALVPTEAPGVRAVALVGALATVPVVTLAIALVESVGIAGVLAVEALATALVVASAMVESARSVTVGTSA